MERDVNSYLQRGAALDKIVAGLAYSVATNYINRVVRGRKIGEVIFFQGGTAYNDAVAAAFSSILGKRIIVPPFNGVMGALGVALLAREKMARTSRAERASAASTSTRSTTTSSSSPAKAAPTSARCSASRSKGSRPTGATSARNATARPVKCEREPVIENLVEYRRSLLLADYDPDAGSGPVVGMPLCMSTYEWAPFWFIVMRELGIRVLLSEPTTNQIVKLGLESVVSEPCFPIQVAHGHIRLADREAGGLHPGAEQHFGAGFPGWISPTSSAHGIRPSPSLRVRRRSFPNPASGLSRRRSGSITETRRLPLRSGMRLRKPASAAATRKVEAGRRAGLGRHGAVSARA